MAEEVISGGQQIASEATLQALLSAVAGTGGASAAMQVQKLATASGVAGKQVEDFGSRAGNVVGAAQGLTKSFIQGTATSSQMFGALGSLPGPIGLVFEGLSKIAAFQEEAMAQYQKMSSSGINFGGSLTEMRKAAADTHMTLGQFVEFMKANSADMVRLGGSANEGAKAFRRLSNEMLTSEAGNNLKALGYTSEQVNQGMMSYIALTGGRTKEELKNSKEILAGSQRYLEQMDRMADITGQSREQLEKDLKRKQEEADIEIMKANMTVKEREAFNAALTTYGALYGKAGEDMVVAAAQGRSVTTEEGKKLAALAPNLASKINDSYQTNLKYGAESKQALDLEKQSRLAAQEDLRRFGGTVGTVGGLTKGLEKAFITSAKDIQAGNTTRNALDEAEKKRAEEKAAREASEAKDMAVADTNIKNFSAALIGFISPFVKFLTPVISALSALTPVIGAVAFALTALKVAAYAKERLGIGSAAGRVAGSVPTPPIPGGGAAPGGGAGGGFVGFIRSLGRSLASLAPIAVPMLIGAGAVAGVITLLGAGVAAAVALIGISLPVFAKGLKEVAEIDGLNLAKVALGIAALGPALVIFTGGSLIAGLGAVGTRITNFFSGGGPIGQIKDAVVSLSPYLTTLEALGVALSDFSNGIMAYGRALSTVDIAKAERLKEVMKGPGVLEGIGTAIRDVGSATAKLMTSNAGGQEKSGAELATLNNTVRDLVKVSREIADYTKQTVEATKKLNGDHFA